MKATEAQLLAFLKKSPQFIIPIYQRTYSWTERECRQLWDDILRTGKDDEIKAHFVGSIVYIENGLFQVMAQPSLLVIDGQQRLTTLTLLLAALAKALSRLDDKSYEAIDGFSARKIRNYYLLNPEESDERHYKLILSQTDKDSLIAIVSEGSQPKEQSKRVTQNFSFFESWIDECKDDLVPLCRGLFKLIVVDIALSRDNDNPQLIFESMNSTGRELSQADLIRNFILMGLEPGTQAYLYGQHWRPMEVDFGQQAYSDHFDSFMRHYLTVKTGEIPNINEVYERFKSYARSPKTAQAGVGALVADIRSYSHYFCAMALDGESNIELRAAFHDLRELRVDVAYPFLLELYHDYFNNVLSGADFVAAVRLVEAYVFRRAICAIPTNSLNKTFANFTKALKKDRYLESIQAHLLTIPSYRGFPTDEEFRAAIQSRDLYKFPRRLYCLRKLENFDRKEKVAVDEYTIEHILPQNEKLSAAWKLELGTDWKRVQETWLHTLGNLTLTGYNSEYGDRTFKEKRDMKGGFKESPLRLNHGLGQLEAWNEESIKHRAAQLSELASKVWALPVMPAGILAAYRPPAVAPSYSLSDHPNLLVGSMREVFDSLRKEILALDPCVTEEFLKVYIAYKAETNFVDLVPQAKRLRLTLNLLFSEINDPKKICRDVTGIGQWGNGDVAVDLASPNEIPYVMGLVRQSFERQMGSVDEE